MQLEIEKSTFWNIALHENWLFGSGEFAYMKRPLAVIYSATRSMIMSIIRILTSCIAKIVYETSWVAPELEAIRLMVRSNSTSKHKCHDI